MLFSCHLSHAFCSTYSFCLVFSRDYDPDPLFFVTESALGQNCSKRRPKPFYTTMGHQEAHCRADSRFAPSQWETALRCNAVSHWLGGSLESALHIAFDGGLPMWLGQTPKPTFSIGVSLGTDLEMANCKQAKQRLLNEKKYSLPHKIWTWSGHELTKNIQIFRKRNS